MCVPRLIPSPPLALAWSETLVVSAARREVMSPVRVVSKNPTSICMQRAHAPARLRCTCWQRARYGDRRTERAGRFGHGACRLDACACPCSLGACASLPAGGYEKERGKEKKGMAGCYLTLSSDAKRRCRRRTLSLTMVHVKRPPRRPVSTPVASDTHSSCSTVWTNFCLPPHSSMHTHGIVMHRAFLSPCQPRRGTCRAASTPWQAACQQVGACRRALHAHACAVHTPVGVDGRVVDDAARAVRNEGRAQRRRGAKGKGQHEHRRVGRRHGHQLQYGAPRVLPGLVLAMHGQGEAWWARLT